MTTASEHRPQCPHCGCSYFVYGNTPNEGICHDCGRTFEIPPYDPVDDLVSMFQDLDPEQKERFLRLALD
jgi:hypothetical protein